MKLVFYLNSFVSFLGRNGMNYSLFSLNEFLSFLDKFLVPVFEQSIYNLIVIGVLAKCYSCFIFLLWKLDLHQTALRIRSFLDVEISQDVIRKEIALILFNSCKIFLFYLQCVCSLDNFIDR